MGRKTETSRREHYCLFDTPIGTFGAVWSEHGLVRLKLPGADRSETEKRLRAAVPGATAGGPAAEIEDVIARIRQYLSGRRVDFSPVPLDLVGAAPFHQKVYRAARAIEWGRTVSYGDLAREAGSPGAARAVGQALGRNPVAIIIPCHRILASGNKVGGFTAFGGTFTKERLLALEGVHINETPEDVPTTTKKASRRSPLG